VCGLTKASVLETDALALTETAEAIQAVWVEDDNILIVASDIKYEKTTVWLGVPQRIGIFTFTPHPDLISGAVSPGSLQVATTYHKRATVVSHDKKHMFVTSNGGQTWIQVSLPSSEFDEAEDLHISDVSPDHMILVAGTELYHTHSAGEQWEVVASHVKLVRMVKLNRHNEFVFYLTPGKQHVLNTLHRLSLPSGDKDVLDTRVYRFAVHGHYLFISRQNFTGNSIADDASRQLYVCDHYGDDASDISFREVQLPSVTPEQFYVIMATHEAGAFIHVSLQSTRATGSLYVSDSSGTRYSLSLSNHFYKVYYVYIKGTAYRFSVDDFYEVQSMRGVYITTAVTESATLTQRSMADEMSNHVTMITFNNGGEWSRLRPPDSIPHCHYPTCSLHLHLHYSQMMAHMLNRSYSAGLLSVETAAGIIIGHGSIGVTRNDSEPRLVLSNDGGYSWMSPPELPVGTYVYGIADYGNIIAVALDSEHVEHIWFSHDRGECFVQQLLDSTNAFSLSRGLLMDPRASSLTAFVMGVEGDDETDEWRMITLNFKSLLQRKCLPSDYHSWTEHVTSDSCVLGYKDTYNLTKTSSICYNEQGYNYKPIRHERCFCSYEDLECDYGYNRTDPKTCTKMKNYDLARDCPPGAKNVNKTESGFRLILGDRCKATHISKQELTWEVQPCTGHEKDSGYDITAARRAGASAGKIVGGIIIALVIVAVAVVAFYGFLKCREHIPDTYEKVLYQKLPTSDTKFSAADDSSSDDDLITPSNPFQDT
jgi:sortilin